jgi:methionyl-tRNA formyltransferase
MSNKILFFGNERLASGVTTSAPVLRALIAAGYEITGLVVAQNEAGATRKARELEIVQVASGHGIGVLSPAKLSGARDELAALGAELGVLIAYGKMVPQSIIDIFPRGIVNIHPSLLPKHRGPTPIESVILNGENETGTSLMRLSAGMDGGPVFAQSRLALRGDEGKSTLTAELLELGKGLLIEHLPAILNGKLQPQSQNDADATYDTKLTKDLSALDWQKPAARLAREVRAYAGWPRSRTTINGTDVIVTQAHAAEADGGGRNGHQNGQPQPGTWWQAGQQFGFYTADGVFIIDSLIPAGKKAMPAAAFLAGYLPK